MALLDFVQNFCLEQGLGQPSAVVTSSDPQIQQILALCNRLGRDIARSWEWQKLRKEALVTTVSTTTTGNTTINSPIVTNIPSTAAYSTNFQISGLGIPNFAQIQSIDSATQVTLIQNATATGVGVALTVAQTAYPLASDWLREIPQTEWDRTDRWPMVGPVSAQDWQAFKSGIVYAGPRLRFRIIGTALNINPPPANGLTLAYEYISANWVTSAAGVGKATFTADTDVFAYDVSMFTAGLLARWMRIKGFDWQPHMQEFYALLDTCKAQDHSAPALSLAPRPWSYLLTDRNIPETGYGP